MILFGVLIGDFELPNLPKYLKQNRNYLCVYAFFLRLYSLFFLLFSRLNCFKSQKYGIAITYTHWARVSEWRKSKMASSYSVNSTTSTNWGQIQKCGDFTMNTLMRIEFGKALFLAFFTLFKRYYIRFCACFLLFNTILNFRSGARKIKYSKLLCLTIEIENLLRQCKFLFWNVF